MFEYYADGQLTRAKPKDQSFGSCVLYQACGPCGKADAKFGIKAVIESRRPCGLIPALGDEIADSLMTDEGDDRLAEPAFIRVGDSAALNWASYHGVMLANEMQAIAFVRHHHPEVRLRKRGGLVEPLPVLGGD